MPEPEGDKLTSTEAGNPTTSHGARSTDPNPSPSPHARRRIATSYIVAALGPVMLIVVKTSVLPIATHPFALAFIAVSAAAWLGGLWPGALAAVLSALGAAYYFIPPIGSFRIDDPLPLFVFVMEATVVIGVIEALQRSRREIERAGLEMAQQRRTLLDTEGQLREALAQLESTSRDQLATAHDARGRAEVALRTTEEQLRQAQKMDAVGRLAGGVAHDFNNLLSVVLSYAEFLLEDLKSGDPMRGDVEEIRKAGQRAAALTHQLLMFSRQQVIEPKVVDLNDLLANMDKMLQRILGEDVELTSLAKEPVGGVLVDPSGMEQVIVNLVVNARDAMPTGGQLTIETANVVLDDDYASRHMGVKPGPHVMLAVTDTGMGMNKATQLQIFEPFFTTKERGKGTGLGLSTVFGIVNQSGGSIWLYSELGKGTTFKVYFPLSADRVEAVEAEIVPATIRGTETILLVEDEDQVRVVARGILVRNGYTVLEARNAGEALLICEKQVGTIDLLLSDVVMPQMSGPELAKRLSSARPTMRVLCMSGYTDDSIVRHGVLEAHFAFLQKPLTPETLTRKVREVLDATLHGGRS